MASPDWVLDSLLGFLQSPFWNVTVNSFIDHNCVGELIPVAYHCNHSPVIFWFSFEFQCLIRAKRISSLTRIYTENMQHWYRALTAYMIRTDTMWRYACKHAVVWRHAPLLALAVVGRTDTGGICYGFSNYFRSVRRCLC